MVPAFFDRKTGQEARHSAPLSHSGRGSLGISRPLSGLDSERIVPRMRMAPCPRAPRRASDTTAPAGLNGSAKQIFGANGQILGPDQSY